jgi:putative SOS response-associated peptidase YedK
MCGRFILTSPGIVLAAQFELQQEFELPPRYNIAPTQQVSAIRMDTSGRRLEMLKWGLLPFWAKDASISARLINARSETLSEKPAFRAAFKSRRCLIPSNGFYEWTKNKGQKQPYLIKLTEGSLFAFAGLWEHWESKDGVDVESCTIITTHANELVQPLHDRMPVILKNKDYALWLDPIAKREILQPLLIPYPSEEMNSYPVSSNVNKATYDSPDSIEPMFQEGSESQSLLS